jgi:hypothetical protein
MIRLGWPDLEPGETESGLWVWVGDPVATPAWVHRALGTRPDFPPRFPPPPGDAVAGVAADAAEEQRQPQPLPT